MQSHVVLPRLQGAGERYLVAVLPRRDQPGGEQHLVALLTGFLVHGGQAHLKGQVVPALVGLRFFRVVAASVTPAGSVMLPQPGIATPDSVGAGVGVIGSPAFGSISNSAVGAGAGAASGFVLCQISTAATAASTTTASSAPSARFGFFAAPAAICAFCLDPRPSSCLRSCSYSALAVNVSVSVYVPGAGLWPCVTTRLNSARPVAVNVAATPPSWIAPPSPLRV